MNKSELIAQIAEKSKLTKAEATRALDAFTIDKNSATLKSVRNRVHIVHAGGTEQQNKKARDIVGKAELR